MKTNAHRTDLFMVPAGEMSGILKPKPRGHRNDPDTVGMYFHKNRSVVFWSNLDPDSYQLPDPVKSYSVTKTEIVYE